MHTQHSFIPDFLPVRGAAISTLAAELITWPHLQEAELWDTRMKDCITAFAGQGSSFW